MFQVDTKLPNMCKYEKQDQQIQPIVEELKGIPSGFPVTIVYINNDDWWGPWPLLPVPG